MLRAYDFFFDLQRLPGFWTRIQGVTNKLFGAAHMEDIVKRYINARRRYLDTAGSSPRVAKGLQLVITNLTDKLISKTLAKLEKKKPSEEEFNQRAKAWSHQSKDLGVLFGRLQLKRSSEYAARDLALRAEAKAKSIKDESPSMAGSPVQRRAVSPPLNVQDHQASGRKWPQPFGRPNLSPDIPPGNLQARITERSPSERPTGIPSFQDSPSHPQENGSPTTPRVKRPAAADFMSSSSKRQAMQADSPYSPQMIPEADRLSQRATSVGLSDTYSPTKTFARPVIKTPDVFVPPLVKNAADRAMADGKEASVELKPQSRSLEERIASPTSEHPTVARHNAKLQRLQRELLAKTREAQQLQELLREANDAAMSLQQKRTGLSKAVVELKEEKTVLAQALKEAQDKLETAAVAASIPPAPTDSVTNGIKISRQLMMKQFVARRDYRSLLSHIAADLPQMAKPIVSSLRQEAGDEDSPAWRALENVWVALDWAEKQAALNVESL